MSVIDYHLSENDMMVSTFGLIGIRAQDIILDIKYKEAKSGELKKEETEGLRGLAHYLHAYSNETYRTRAGSTKGRMRIDYETLMLFDTILRDYLKREAQKSEDDRKLENNPKNRRLTAKMIALDLEQLSSMAVEERRVDRLLRFTSSLSSTTLAVHGNSNGLSYPPPGIMRLIATHPTQS